MNTSRIFTSAVRLTAVAAAVGAILAASTPAWADASSRPNIVELTVFPERLELHHIRDGRKLLVTGKDEAGKTHDLSAEARLSASHSNIAVDRDGFIIPQANGHAEVTVSAAGLQVAVPVVVQDASPKPVSFVREIMPVLTKVGCNSGTCHGSQNGQNGFKLSLRGYDPLYDYRALVDDISGRRFNRAMPAQSLMLLKPTQGVPHEGGFLFDEDSRAYALIRDWIAEGCQYDAANRAVRIEVFPKKPLLDKSGERQQQIVIAYFEDGSSRDVTRDAAYETSNFEVATVTKTGRIEAVRRGEAAVLVRYEGLFGTNPVTVLGDRDGFQWKNSPEYNFVDTHVNRKLRRMKILPSQLCTDAEFLRRLSLDLTGVPPTAEQVREFVNDPRDSKAKRDAKIDELLKSPAYIDQWTLKWSDLLMSNREFITLKGVWAFRNWIRNAIATNMPYDQFVRELITASGSTFENPAANYYRIAREPEVVMENMTQLFIGTRFMCAKCHDHPFERWTQTQYYELSAYFSDVGRKKGPNPEEEIIYSLANPKPVLHASTGEAVDPAFPYTHPGMSEQESAESLRKRLAEWLAAEENPYFATSLVNRYWSYFLGRGIIDPVDDIRASNPPSNPELLEALAKDFVDQGFDLKHLVRTIVRSHTYQRSYKANEWNANDAVNFSHALPRRLTAEQLYDAIITATGAPRQLPGVPSGFRAAQLPDSKVQVGFLDMFGRPPRESPCECERTSEVSLSQTLNLINGPTIADAIVHPQGLIAQLSAQNGSDETLIEEVYLSVVCRYPTDDEVKMAKSYFVEVSDSAQAAQDLMWALINSPAFLFNR